MVQIIRVTGRMGFSMKVGISKILTDLNLVVSEFVQQASEEAQQPVRAFPTMSELFEGPVLNLKEVVTRIAKYEYEHVRIANMLSEAGVKKLQLSTYSEQLQKAFPSDSTDSFIAKKTKLLYSVEVLLKRKMDLIKECIGSLKSFQASYPKG